MKRLIYLEDAIDALCDNCDDVKAVCAHYPCKRYIAIEQLPSAQPEQIARDIATIIENEQDMRVLLKNTERTKKHDLVSRRAAIKTAKNVAYYVDEHGSANGWLAMLVNWLEILPSAQPEHTETHSCDYERTETHDLISRQAAIDSVCENCEYFYNEKLIQTIKDLPSAQPESRREWYMHGYRDAKPKWTPVSSESMPEDGVTVWVTIKGHDVIKCEEGETLEQAVARISKMRRVSEGFWCDDDKTWYNAGGYPMMVQPIAWMPMEVPEPYKGGESDA